MQHGAQLIETLEWQKTGCLGLGSPFYAAICEQLEIDVEHDGPATRLLAQFARAPFDSAYILRYLAGFHRLVLTGGAPDLARHFPSTGGDGDAAAAVARMAELMADPPALVLDALTRPPQTNEVGRSVALASGLLVVAEETGLPLSLREVGASAGLNLRLDAYWYEQDGRGWGDPESTVRFVDLWDDGAPPFGNGAVVADRLGCDPNPIDVTTDDGAIKLLSYVWPEPPERFRRARAAIAIARNARADVEPVMVANWLPRQLDARRPGTALVVFHSVVWQYLDESTKAAMATELFDAGRSATPETPLAWLRLEPNAMTFTPAELRLVVWNGRDANPAERLLATTNFHGGRIRWVDGSLFPE